MSALTCRVCRGPVLGPVLDLGVQPVTQRLLPVGRAPGRGYPLRVTQCLRCGGIQIAEPFPYLEFVPTEVGAVTREPETHLDDTVERLLRRLSGVSTPSILALSLKDATTLDRLAAHGVTNVRIVDAFADLGATDPAANIETIQTLFTPEAARAIVARNGQVDCVIVRHVLEHVERPFAFLEAVKICLKPGGIVLCEVPECGAALRAREYPVIWEEHVIYFTAHTLRALFAAADFGQIDVTAYPNAFEDSLVLMATAEAGTSEIAAAPEDIAMFAGAVAEFPDIKQRLHARIEAARGEGRAYLFGAGHLAASFVNYFGLGHLFAGALDDNPKKHGHRLSGSLLEIFSSRDARVKDVTLCVLAVNPDIEDRLAAKVAETLGPRTTIKSAFMRSARSLA